jgi:hypothetical protein
VGDVVLLKDETAVGSTYKLARVIEIIRDERDGKVRKVTVAYKNFSEKTFRTSMRPIQKVVLVVPAEDVDLPPLPPQPHDDQSARLASSVESPAEQPDVDSPPPESAELEAAPPIQSEIPSDTPEAVIEQEEVLTATTPTGDSAISINPLPNPPPAHDALETPEATEGHPEEPEATRGLQENLTVPDVHSTQPEDRTHGGRLRPRKTFYSWDFHDRMKRS